jgi:CHAT domain-containing protein/tetratricopeptide (TPR) repeat protein
MGILGDIRNYLRRFGGAMAGLKRPLYENSLTAEEIEEVVTSLKAHLDDPLFRDRKKHHAFTHLGLAVCYHKKAIYHSNLNKDDINSAIRSAHEAEVFLTREASPRGWELIQQILGAAYFVSSDGSRPEHYELAVPYLENALESSESRQKPEYQFELRLQLMLACANRLSGSRSEKVAKIEEHAAKALELIPAEQRAESEYAKHLREIKVMALFGAEMDGGVGRITKNIVEALPGIFGQVYGDDPPKGKSIHRATDVLHGMMRFDETLNSLLARTSVAPEELERLKEKYKNNASNDLTEILSPEHVQILSGLLGELIEENLTFADDTESASDRIECHTALALMYLQQSLLKYEESGREESLGRARFHFERAWEGLLSSGRPFDIFMRGRIFGTLLYFRRGRWHEAEKYYGAALEILDRSYGASPGVRGKHSTLSDVSGESISIPLLLNQAYALARTGRPEEAFVLLEKWRGRRLNERLKRTDRQLARVKPADLSAYNEAWRDISDLEAAQRSAAGDEYARLVTRLQEARAALEAVTRRVRRYLPDFLLEPTFEEVRQAATAAVPLAYILTTDVGSLTLTVSAGGKLSCLWCDDFASGDLEDVIIKLSPTLGLDDSAPDDGGASVALPAVLLELEERLLAPLVGELKEARAGGVCLIPCGPLSLLPLHAVLLTAFEDSDEPFEVSHAPSAKALLSARRKLNRIKEGGRGAASILLGVADTACDLPHAVGEAAAIARLFTPPASARLLLRESATKDAIKTALPEATHIHFACHGDFNLSEPLENALVLANGDRLTLRDILDGGEFQLSPDATIVVLSACRTAMIDFRELPEEVVGLSTGFLSAGVPGVVGTLWPVDDLSTALLMARFYAHLVDDRMTPASALSAAQRWLRSATQKAVEEFCVNHPNLRNSSRAREARLRPRHTDPSRHRPFSSPYYWAGFVLIGA